MSSTAVNARSAQMGPPVNPLKRKTLVERAGEIEKKAPAPSSSRPTNGYVKTTSIAGAARDASFSSSVSSLRPSSSASTRNLSASSYGSSVGPGTRPPSGQSYRSQSSLGHSRIQKPLNAYRPATSLEVHEEEPMNGRPPNKRKGMTPLSLNPQDPPQSLHAPKVRGRNGFLKHHASNPEFRNPFSLRDVSLSTQFEKLSINGKLWQPAPIAEADERPCSPLAQSPSRGDCWVPKNPSHLPKLAPRTAIPAETPSPSKPPRKTPKRTSVFLTRDSNLKSTALDMDKRLDEVESMYSELKETVDGANAESKSLKDQIGLYRIRSRYTSTRSESKLIL